MPFTACSDSEFSEPMNLFGRWVELLVGGISRTQGLYLHRTTKHRETRKHLHAPSGIRTPDPSVRVVPLERQEKNINF
jgi:hypothetical protein